MSFNANANGQKIDPPLSKEEERLRALIQSYPCDNSHTTTCLSVLKGEKKKEETICLLDFLTCFECFEFEDAAVLFLPSVWLIMGHINSKIFEIVIILGNLHHLCRR